MALSVSLIKSVVNALVTGSFTPSDNSLLIVLAGVSDNASLSVAGGSLSWTPRKSIASSGGFDSECYCWTAPVTTGASMTVTVSGTSQGSSAGIAVYQATGYDTTTPVGATGSSSANAGSSVTSLSYSLSASPASTSYLLAITSSQTNSDTSTGVSAGSGWTLDTPTSWGTLVASNPVGAESKTGTTSATVAWTNVALSDSAYSNASVAVEIKQAGGGGGSAYVAGQSALSFLGMQ